MNHGQYRIASQLVEAIHQDFQGFHAGYRDVHSSGRYYAGTFTATLTHYRANIWFVGCVVYSASISGSVSLTF